jgi:hypothetical protein
MLTVLRPKSIGLNHEQNPAQEVQVAAFGKT